MLPPAIRHFGRFFLLPAGARRLARCLTAALLTLGLVTPTLLPAAITVSHWYRFGEDDPGAVSGALASTRDSVGTNHLANVGSPFYDSRVSTEAAARVGSSLCLWVFTGGPYVFGPIISTATDNFGLEAWVKTGTTTGSHCLAYNGSTSGSGWGIYQVGNTFQGLFGGVAFFGNGTVTVDTWTHLAIVRAGGVARLYVNGVDSGNTTASAPITPSGGFGVGAPPPAFNAEFGNGFIDEVRSFTFAAGQFSINDLLRVAPNITVAQPAGSGIAKGGSRNFGTVNLGTPTSLTFTIGNDGLSSLASVTASVQGANASEFSITTAPATSVAVGATTTCTVTFTPTVGGAKTAALLLTSSDPGDSPFMVNLAGLGNAPEISVFTGASTAPIDERTDNVGTVTYALTPVGGSSAAQTFTVQNVGGASLTGLALSNSGTNTADFTVSSLGATTLAPNATTTFTVTFSPQAGGSRSAVVNLASNDPNENPFRINVAGTGGAPEISVFDGSGTGGSERFDNVGTVTYAVTSVGGSSAAQTFTIKNIGGANLTGLALSKSGTTPADFTTSTLGVTTLAPNATTSFTVTFTPQAGGARSAVVNIASNDADENPFRINVAGTGGTPEISVFDGSGTGGSERFDNVGTASFANTAVGANSVAQTFTIQNIGGSNLTGLALSKSGTGAADYALGTLGVASLAPGGTATFTVTFSPLVSGTRAAIVNIASNDADENPFRINVTGSGQGPEIAVFTGANTLPANERFDNVGTFAFPATVVGTSSAAQIFTIQNTGNTNLDLSALNTLANPSDYVIGAPGLTTLTPGATTTFTVTFTPTADGSRADTLRIFSNDFDEATFRILVSGTGFTPDIAVFNGASTAPANERFIGGAPVVFPDTAVSGTSAALTYTIKNAGTGTLSGLALSKVGAAPGDFVLGSLGATSLAANATTTFTVAFAPTAIGARTATVQIASNDPDENPFTIDVTGSGQSPHLVVEQSGTAVANGGSSDFGTVDIPLNASQTFTVINTGNVPLNLSGTPRAAVSGAQASEFTVTAQPGTPVGIAGVGATVPNAGFETPAFSSGGFAYSPAGSGWNYAGQVGFAAANSPWFVNPAPEGNDAAFLQNGSARLWRSITFPAAGSYGIRFRVVRRGAGYEGNDVVVRVDGVDLLTVSHTSQPDDVWRDFSVVYVCPSAGDHQIEFAGVRGDAGDVASALDDIRVESNVTNFTVRFAPTAAGVRNATLSIASNDVAANPFVIQLTGTGRPLSLIVVEQPAGTTLIPTGSVSWGSNPLGQLSAPADVVGMYAISAGYYHTLALVGGGIRAWGYNAGGQANPPADLGPIRSMVAGGTDSVVLQPDGIVRAWGDNGDGQANVPAGLTNVKAIGAGGFSGLAVKTNGSVVYWGTTFFGGQNLPAGLTGVRAVAAGYGHMLALKGDGTVVGWGYNSYGQTSPPGGLTGVKAIAAGGDSSIALKSDGTVVAWGLIALSYSPPAGLSGVVGVALGDKHALALKSDGTVVAWGDPAGGVLAVPPGLTTARAITSGYNQCHALTGTTVNFGAQNVGGSGLAKTFVIKNPGLAPLALSNLVVTGRNPADFGLNLTGTLTSVPAGGQTTLAVNFLPVGSGSRQASLRLTSNVGSQPEFEILLSGDGVAPQLGVEQPINSVVPPTTTRDFGAVTNGQNASLTFTVRNSGTINLLLTGTPRVTVSGANASEFVITAQPGATVIPAATTTFVLRFTPTAGGVRLAKLTLNCNDAEQSPFEINVTGTGQGFLTPQELWRQQYFGSPANSGNGADNFDFDSDGLPNLLEYALGLDPTSAASAQLPAPQLVGGNLVLAFTPPAGISGVTYLGEWSINLQSWTALPDIGVAPEHRFSVPIGTDAKKFIRLRVTSP